MALLTEVNGCYSAAFYVATCQSIFVLKQVGKRASQEQGSSNILKMLQKFWEEKCCKKRNNCILITLRNFILLILLTTFKSLTSN